MSKIDDTNGASGSDRCESKEGRGDRQEGTKPARERYLRLVAGLIAQQITAKKSSDGE